MQAADPSARDPTLTHRGLRAAWSELGACEHAQAQVWHAVSRYRALSTFCWTHCSQPLPRCVLNSAGVCNLHWFKTIKSALPSFATLPVESYYNYFSIYFICHFLTFIAQEQPRWLYLRRLALPNSDAISKQASPLSLVACSATYTSIVSHLQYSAEDSKHHHYHHSPPDSPHICKLLNWIGYEC